MHMTYIHVFKSVFFRAACICLAGLFQAPISLADTLDVESPDAPNTSRISLTILPPINLKPAPDIPPFASSTHAGLDRWRDAFSKDAISKGHPPLIVYDVLRDLRPLEAYLPKTPSQTPLKSATSEQAEFARPIWDYLQSRVTPSRIEEGAQTLKDMAPIYAQISEAYGVDATAIASIWGMESNFGQYMGNYDAPEALANMAVEGRRRKMAERELLAIMQIVENGYAERNALIASWAGAMGQTQFMPSTYMAYAVDFTGDGKRDVWADRADALASAANYLKSSGYVRGEPWGLEVTVSDDFDYGLSDGHSRSLTDWQSLGIALVRPLAEPDKGKTYQARLWLPTGASGPKYLLFKNFDVFLVYNRSYAYALSVGLLADAIGGKIGPVTPWPTELKQLSKAQIKRLQAGLNTLGFEAGPVDGVAGTGTRRALRAFQVSAGLIADSYPTHDMLAHLDQRVAEAETG